MTGLQDGAASEDLRDFSGVWCVWMKSDRQETSLAVNQSNRWRRSHTNTQICVCLCVCRCVFQSGWVTVHCQPVNLALTFPQKHIDPANQIKPDQSRSCSCLFLCLQFYLFYFMHWNSACVCVPAYVCVFWHLKYVFSVTGGELNSGRRRLRWTGAVKWL